MNLNKVMAVISWLNAFAMIWAILLIPMVNEGRWSSVLAAIFFCITAVIFTSQAGQPGQPGKPNDSK